MSSSKKLGIFAIERRLTPAEDSSSMPSSEELDNYTTGGRIRQKRIHFPCPECGCRLKELEENGGKVDKCPACKASFVIPALKKARVPELPGVSKLQRLLNEQKSIPENRIVDVVKADLVRDDEKFANFLIELDAKASKSAADTARPAAIGGSADTKAVPNHIDAKGRDDRSAVVGSVKPKANDDIIEFMPPTEDEPLESTAVQLTGENLNVSTKLTSCEDCGKQVSKKASHCPNCGCPVVVKELKRRDVLVLSTGKKTNSISEDLSDKEIKKIVAIFGGILVMIVALVLAFESANEVASLVERTPNTASQVVTTNPVPATINPVPVNARVFRKELFDKVRRSAIQFKSNSPQFPEQLRLELTLIAGEISSTSEQKAFETYERIEDLQRSIAIIENLRKETEAMVGKYKLNKLEAITRKLSAESDLMDREIAALSGDSVPFLLSVPDKNVVAPGQIDELLNAHNSGLVIVDMGLSDNALVWCRKHGLSIIKLKFFSYIQYQPHRKNLEVDLAANLTAAETFVHYKHE